MESGVMAQLMVLLYSWSSCCIGSKFLLCHLISLLGCDTGSLDEKTQCHISEDGVFSNIVVKISNLQYFCFAFTLGIINCFTKCTTYSQSHRVNFNILYVGSLKFV